MSQRKQLIADEKANGVIFQKPDTEALLQLKSSLEHYLLRTSGFRKIAHLDGRTFAKRILNEIHDPKNAKKVYDFYGELLLNGTPTLLLTTVNFLLTRSSATFNGIAMPQMDKAPISLNQTDRVDSLLFAAKLALQAIDDEIEVLRSDEMISAISKQAKLVGQRDNLTLLLDAAKNNNLLEKERLEHVNSLHQIETVKAQLLKGLANILASKVSTAQFPVRKKVAPQATPKAVANSSGVRLDEEKLAASRAAAAHHSVVSAPVRSSSAVAMHYMPPVGPAPASSQMPQEAPPSYAVCVAASAKAIKIDPPPYDADSQPIGAPAPMPLPSAPPQSEALPAYDADAPRPLVRQAVVSAPAPKPNAEVVLAAEVRALPDAPHRPIVIAQPRANVVSAPKRIMEI